MLHTRNLFLSPPPLLFFLPFITLSFFSALPLQIKNVRKREKKKNTSVCRCKYNGTEPTAHVNEINPQEKKKKKETRPTTPTFPRVSIPQIPTPHKTIHLKKKSYLHVYLFTFANLTRIATREPKKKKKNRFSCNQPLPSHTHTRNTFPRHRVPMLRRRVL